MHIFNDRKRNPRQQPQPNRLVARRSLLAGLATVPLLLTVNACNRDRHGTRISLALSTLNNPFFVGVRDGALAQARADGVDLLVLDAQNDAETQLNQLQTAAVNGSKGVIVNPVDSDAARSAVVPLLRAHIPVIAVDRGVTGRDLTSLIASNNVAGGRQAAELLAKSSKGHAKVLILEGQAGASATRERGKGFTDGIRAYPGIEVVASQPADFDRAKALDVTQNLMQAHPDVTAIYAHNDEMALGALKALGSKAGRTVKVIGFDGSPEGLKAVQDGSMTATIAQQPAQLGRTAVKEMVATLAGKPVPKNKPIDVKTVTADNVRAFTAQQDRAK